MNIHLGSVRRGDCAFPAPSFDECPPRRQQCCLCYRFNHGLSARPHPSGSLMLIVKCSRNVCTRGRLASINMSAAMTGLSLRDVRQCLTTFLHLWQPSLHISLPCHVRFYVTAWFSATRSSLGPTFRSLWVGFDYILNQRLGPNGRKRRAQWLCIKSLLRPHKQRGKNKGMLNSYKDEKTVTTMEEIISNKNETAHKNTTRWHKAIKEGKTTTKKVPQIALKSGNMSIKYETTQDATQQRCQTALDAQTIPSFKSRWRHWWLPLCLDTELSDLIFCFEQYHEVADKCLFLVFPGCISCSIIILVFVLSKPEFKLYFWVSIHGKHQ